MRFIQFFPYSLVLFIISCNPASDPVHVIQKTINSIDTINSIHYKQTLKRGNSEDTDNESPKERIFYYQRLKSDSIIGAKAHIYFYDGTTVFNEDIYDGNRLIRKHNVDSTARIFDLTKYPELKKRPFWGKTSPYTIQYMLNYALENKADYKFGLGSDTIINDISCYCVKTILEKKALMPGFYISTIDTNRVETMVVFVSKLNYFPQAMRMEAYFLDNPDVVYFTEHHFYEINFNPYLNDSLFETDETIVKEFEITESEK